MSEGIVNILPRGLPPETHSILALILLDKRDTIFK